MIVGARPRDVDEFKYRPRSDITLRAGLTISGLSGDGSRNLHADRTGKIAFPGAFPRIA
jgi:hypothetical protein